MNFFHGRLESGGLRLGPHAFELPESVTRKLRSAPSDVIVGVRPEDFLLGGDGSVSISARVEISERLGPEVLVHLRASDLPVADVGAQATPDNNKSSDRLNSAIVARFDPEFSSGTGDTVDLGLNREKIRLFDPQSGASLLNRDDAARFVVASREHAAESDSPAP